MIEVAVAGALTSIQDRGRAGQERFGIPRGGALDRFSAAVANLLVGNSEDAALLECTLRGPRLTFLRPATIAVTGGDSAGPTAWCARKIVAGQTLDIGPIRPGLRCYVGVRGGIMAPRMLGGRGLSTAGGFGGLVGRALQAGDHLSVGRLAKRFPLNGTWPPGHRLPLQGPWEVRVVLGPHAAAFPADALDRFIRLACRVTPRIDRMGMRLSVAGRGLHGDEILTTPVTEGAIQVTSAGELIALLADHPTTGGYPVIATVIQADLPFLAQARPGDTVHFRTAHLDEANRARRRLGEWLSAPLDRFEPSP